MLICSALSNQSMGQVILVRKNFPYEVRSVLKMDRLLCTGVNINENTTSITNVYSPNISKEKKTFIKFINDNINKFKTDIGRF